MGNGWKFYAQRPITKANGDGHPLGKNEFWRHPFNAMSGFTSLTIVSNTTMEQ
jgi:hypothetical protein